MEGIPDRVRLRLSRIVNADVGIDIVSVASTTVCSLCKYYYIVIRICIYKLFRIYLFRDNIKLQIQ